MGQESRSNLRMEPFVHEPGKFLCNGDIGFLGSAVSKIWPPQRLYSLAQHGLILGKE